eukprot:15275472-Alexandrium_andersonii.AAC.1
MMQRLTAIPPHATLQLCPTVCTAPPPRFTIPRNARTNPPHATAPTGANPCTNQHRPNARRR